MTRALAWRWMLVCGVVLAAASLVPSPESARGGPSATFVFPLKLSGKLWDTTQVGSPGKKLGVGKVKDKTVAAVLRSETTNAASDYLHLDSSGRFFLYYDGKETWRVATNQFATDVTTLAGQVANDGTFWMFGEYDIPMGAGTGHVFATGKVKFERGVFDPKSIKGVAYFFSADIQIGMIVKFKTAKSVAELAPICGDGIKAGTEECDGADDLRCPGECQGNCRCPSVCGNGRKDQGELCDGNDGVCATLEPALPCKPTCDGCVVCGDGQITPGFEECDAADDTPCPGRCLSPECVCGCDETDPNSCPDALCCSPGHRCCAPRAGGFASDDPDCPMQAVFCNGGGVLPSGICGGLRQPGSTCPDDPADPNEGFYCHTCGGKFVSNTCNFIQTETCVLENVGPIP